MAAVTVTYVTLPASMSVIALNDVGVVALNISAAAYTAEIGTSGQAGHVAAGPLVGCTVDNIKCVTISTAQGTQAVVFNDEACWYINSTGVKLLKSEYLLTGLETPLIHEIHVSIRFGADEKRYKKESVKVLGDMDIPVIVSVGAGSDGTDTAVQEDVLLTIEPNATSTHAKLLTDDINNVRIQMVSTAGTASYDFAPAVNGKYTISNLAVGTEYKFSCFMYNSSNNSSVKSNIKSHTVSNTRAVPTPTTLLTHTILDGKDLRLNVSSITDNDATIGTVQQIADFRYKAILLRTFVVPANKLLPAAYVPLEKEFSAPTRFDFSYDSSTKKSTLAASALKLSDMNGRTVVYQAAMVNTNGTGVWSTIARVTVAVAVAPAPAITVGADLSVSAVAHSVVGLQLLGYEYSTVDANGTDLDYGAWSCDGELEIAGSKTTASVTLSAFNGILGNGADLYPSVSSRSPVVKYVVDGTASAKPYFKLRARAIYAPLGSLVATNFLKSGQSYGRADGSGTLALGLKINANLILAVGYSPITTEWATSATQVVTVPLTAVAVGSITGPAISVEGERIYATISMADAEATHKTFLAANAKSVVSYYVMDKKNPSAARVPLVVGAYELPSTTKLSAKFEIPRGRGHEYVLMGEVLLGADKIGSIPERAVALPVVVQGADRALAGMYTSHPADILAADDEILAHNAAESAVFAIEYSGKFSEDNAMDDLYDDSKVEADYKLTNFKTSDDLILGGDWAALGTQPTVAVEKKIHSKNGKKYFVFKINTSLSALKRHKCEFHRQYQMVGNAAAKIVDQFPTSIEFIPVKAPSAPVFDAHGEEGIINASFESNESSLAAAQRAEIEKSLSGMRNDLSLYANRKFAVVKGSTEEEFSHALLATNALVEGSRSYDHPKKYISNGLVSVDADRVSSAAHGRVELNLTAGPAKLTGVSVKTILTAGTHYIKFMCDKPATGISAQVAVSYDDKSEENNDQRFEHALAQDSVDATKFSATVTHTDLKTILGSLTDKNLIENGVRCVFTASEGVRGSAPVAVSHKPNMASTLVAADFKVEQLAGGLKVSTDALSAQQLGGNATLQIKIIASQNSLVDQYGEAKIITLGASGLNETISFGSGIHAVSVIIQKSDLHDQKTIGLGNFAAGAALDAALTFKVAADSKTSLKVDWTHATALSGWALAEQRLYVTGLDLAGKKIWYKGTTTQATETAFHDNALALTVITETLGGLPTGKQLTVALVSKYSKTGHTIQSARVETQAVCAQAPEFLSFNYRKDQRSLTALVAHNGAFLQKFILLAKYDGAAGQVLCDVDLNGADILTSNDKSVMYSVVLPQSGPVPTGFLGFIINENGSDMHADPTGTFGGSAAAGTAFDAINHKVFTATLKQ